MAKKSVLLISHLQGLHYVRANESLPCYVYPTYHSLQDGDDLLNALKAGLRYFHDVDVALVVPITENLIPDPRFAPVEAAKYCDRYQWARIDHYIIGMLSLRHNFHCFLYGFFTI